MNFGVKQGLGFLHPLVVSQPTFLLPDTFAVFAPPQKVPLLNFLLNGENRILGNYFKNMEAQIN